MPSPSSPPAWRESLAATAVALFLILVGVAALQQSGKKSPAAESSVLDEPLALDPAVRTGTLANGIRFYVLANEYPADRAELRLIVDAGSVLEDEDQRGLAHAVEHMAFRGTRNFPGHRAENYLTGMGMRSGSDINASTSFDETIYRLTIPPSRAGALDTAFAILADWATAVTFDPAEARREAGVVLEEWRLDAGAPERLRDVRDTMLLSGSRYAARLPIGDTATLRRFDVAAMRRFYDRWYRPEHMAVVAVGDFAAADVEKLLQQHFGAIPASVEATERPRFVVHRQAVTRAAVFADSEARQTHLSLWFPRRPREMHTHADYRARLVEELARGVLDARLTRIADAPGAPMLDAGIAARAIGRTFEANVVGATVADGRLPDALAVVAAEVARLQRFGATASELDRAKSTLLRRRREAASSGDRSSDLADALAAHFTDGEPMVGREGEDDLARELVAGITAREIARFASSLALDRGGAIVVAMPPGRKVPSPDTLIAIAIDGAARGTERYRDSSLTPVLVAELPRPGTITAERVLRDVDAFDWTLSNGMRVIVKPTRFAEDIVLLRVTGPGGASLASARDYPSAYMADQVLQSTGVGPLDGPALGRLIDETSIDLAPTVTDDRVELQGGAAPRDLEALFQLVHLYFTAARADTAAFRRYRERSLTTAIGREADPEAAFYDSVAAALRPRDVRAHPLSRAFADAITLPSAIGFWHDRVANASNYTVVVVGDFSLERMRGLAQRYLAPLPGGRPEQPLDIVPDFPRGVTERSFARGAEPRAHVQLVFGDTVTLTLAASTALNATRDLVQRVLERRLRENMGGTYGVSASLTVRPAPVGRYSLAVDFSAAPDRIDSLASAALDEIGRLRTRGPLRDDVQRLREAEVRDLDGRLKSNRYWASELAMHAERGWSLGSIMTHAEDPATLSVEMLRASCERFLDVGRYVKVTMRPAAAEPRAVPSAVNARGR